MGWVTRLIFHGGTKVDKYNRSGSVWPETFGAAAPQPGPGVCGRSCAALSLIMLGPFHLWYSVCPSANERLSPPLCKLEGRFQNAWAEAAAVGL